jgi:hypothetical protein
MPQKCHIARSQSVDHRRLDFPKALDEDGQDKCTGVVVGGVSLAVIGNSKGGVLEHAGIVR